MYKIIIVTKPLLEITGNVIVGNVINVLSE